MFRRYVTLAFTAIITLLFVTFAVVNRATVSISLFPLPYSAEMPEFLLIMLCFALGAIVGWLVMSVKLAKNYQRYAAEHKRVQALENQIEGMRIVIPGSSGDPGQEAGTERLAQDPRIKRG